MIRIETRLVLSLMLLSGAFGQVTVGGAAADRSSRGGRDAGDVSEAFFRSAPAPRLQIEIVGTNLARLRQDNRRYVPATVREGTNIYEEVGIHLKGAAGSFRDLNDRPALTLNFEKFVDRQLFHGLDKIALNNSVQDASYMTEILCGELFLAAGVPTPRGTHARVWLNGRDLGVYVLKEGFDKTFLRRHFKNVRGNLYDGGFLKEITDELQRTSGEGPADRSDLRTLARAAEENDRARRLARLDETLDVDRFLSFLALEIMTYHWDGYALKKNNYRLYHDPYANKFVFLPHGMDQMFWEPGFSILPGMEGMVARQLLDIPDGRRRYLERMAGLMDSVFRLEALTNRIQELQARIRPLLAEVSPELARNHDGAVSHLRNQVIQRHRSLEKQLVAHVSKPAVFGQDGCLRPGGWEPAEGGGPAALDRVTDGLRKTLRIRVAREGTVTASWRTKVSLAPGRYKFEGMARTAGVTPLKDGQGQGAGLRISGNRALRTNQLLSDAAWSSLAYDFTVTNGGESTTLVCELRATKGEAWFDLDSFCVRRR